MKHTIIDISNFIKWWIKDIIQHIEFWPTYAFYFVVSIILIMTCDKEIGIIVFELLILSMILIILTYLIIKPIRNKYRQYQDEVQKIADIIKNSN